MQKYVIERPIPGIGTRTAEEMCQAAHTSNDVLARLAPDVQWIHSYVTADQLFCIYLASDEERIREHARLSGFPAAKIHRVTSMIDPTTARQP